MPVGAGITVLYCGVIRIFLFHGFSFVFLTCAGQCLLFSNCAYIVGGSS